jgi:hypothetical protein
MQMQAAAAGMELQIAAPEEEVQATASGKVPPAPLRENIHCSGRDGAAGRAAPPFAPPPHLTPPLLLTAGEGQTEGEVRGGGRSGRPNRRGKRLRKWEGGGGGRRRKREVIQRQIYRSRRRRRPEEEERCEPAADSLEGGGCGESRGSG